MLESILKKTAAALLVALCCGCMNDSGTEIPNELRGALYTSDGAPAVNAQVTLYRVDYIPGDSTVSDSAKFESHTDASGAYSFQNVPAGEYNLLGKGGAEFAYQDSLAIGLGKRNLGKDTLKAPGSLAGQIRLQPQHDPRAAIVQVLGTNYYTNVDLGGGFLLSDLPAGNYRLRVTVLLANYIPLFTGVTIHSGKHDTLALPLEPAYVGIPVVTGLTAKPDSNGTVVLKWEAAPAGKVQSYLIYRDSASALLPSQTPLARTSASTFIDTVYSAAPRAGQFAFTDTVSRSFSYRVRILSPSDEIGPTLAPVQVTAVPPSLWTKAEQGWIAAGTKGFSFIRFTTSSAGYGFNSTQASITANGGAAWANASGTPGAFEAADFPVADTGYVLSSYPSGHIAKITNGIWKDITPSGASLKTLRSLHFLQTSTGYLVGISGTIVKTTDGGVTWTFPASGTARDLNSVRCENASLCYAAGDSGLMLKTTNGGTAWTKQNTGTSKTLGSLSTPAAGIAFALELDQDGNKYVKTTNGGAIWSLQAFPSVLTGAHALYFQDANTGYAVGSGGVILKTRDGGENWAQETSGATADLWDVQCPTPQVCYATGPSAPLRVKYNSP